MRPFRVVIPVRIEGALPRLPGELELRQRLALAMAHDTANAARLSEAVGDVLLLTPDSGVEHTIALPGVGVEVLPAAPTLPEFIEPLAGHDDLPWSRRPTAILMGDVPGVQPAELTKALHASWKSPVVRDLANRRPTLISNHHDWPDLALLRRTNRPLVPGRGARVVHGWGLRADVDTVEGLCIARHLTLGPATAALLATAEVTRLLQRGLLIG